MKHIIITIMGLLIAIIGTAQETPKTEVIIISNGQIIKPEDVEITIKKEGKKEKVNKEDIKIINQKSQTLMLSFDNEDIMNLQNKMQDLMNGFQDFNFNFNQDFFNENFKNDFFHQENVFDFDKEFQNLNSDSMKIYQNKIFLGEGSNKLIFKSDDGGEIIDNFNSNEEDLIKIKKNQEEGNGTQKMSTQKITIKNNTPNKESKITELSNGNPLIFLNGVEYNGRLEDIENSLNIQSVEVHKGDKVQKEYGEKAKDGVIFIKTK